jgi:UDP-N-acetylglucosamine 3-dehydrogenase
MSNLRAGLIGMGMMGKNHARILSKLEGVDFVGAVDPLESENPLAESDGARIFRGLGQLISEKLDYCVIAAPTGFHKEIAVELLNAGVHCLIEKPVATDIESALEVQKAAIRNSRVVGIGHIERYNAAIRQLKNKIQNNELGKIYQISLVRQGPFPSRIAGVGVVRDLATHDIDLSMWLTNSQYSSISAQTSRIKTDEFEDLVSITGRLRNDVVVNMVTNWLSPYKVRSIVVLGENGALHADTLNSDLTYYRNGTSTTSHDVVAHFRGLIEGDVTKFSFEKIEPLVLEHKNFRDRLLGKASEIVTIEEGIETIKISDAIIRIGKTGESEKF